MTSRPPPRRFATGSSSPSRPRRSMASGPMRPTTRPWRRSMPPRDRPAFNPLITHVADAEAAFRLGEFSADARKLALSLLAGALEPGGAATARLPGVAAGQRRIAVDRHSGACASGGAGVSCAPAGARWWRRAPIHRARSARRRRNMCSKHLEGQGGRHSRWRALQGRRRIDRRQLPRRRAEVAAPRRHHAGRDRGSAGPCAQRRSACGSGHMRRDNC